MNSKLCVLICCVSASWAASVFAQTSSSEDQAKALQALREAEAAPVGQPAAITNEAPPPAASSVAPVAPAVSPAAAPVVGQSQALDALRKAESQPVVVDQISPAPAAPTVQPAPAVTPAPTVTPSATVEAAPAVTPAPTVAPFPAVPASSSEQSKALEALRHEEAAPLAPEAAAQKKTENENAAATNEKAQQEAAEAAAQRAAQQESAAATARRSAQEEVARRVDQLRKEMQNAPAQATQTTGAPAAVTPPAVTKEQKLADLLRRYQADEITPYEYHLERAKIIAEP